MSLRSEVIRIMNELLGNSKKISELTSLPSNVQNSDLIEVVRSGQNYKALGSQLPSGGGGGVVETIVAGTNITVDDTDPANPIVSASGGGAAQDLDSVLTEGSTASITTGFEITMLVDGVTTIIRADADGIALSADDGATQMGITVDPAGIGFGGTGGTGVLSATVADTDNSTKVATTAHVKSVVNGVQDLFISAAAMWPRTTNGCAELAKTEMATSLFNIQSLDFDQTTQEFAQFQIVLPRKWNNGTVTAVFYWTAAAGTGDVQWGISGGAYSNDDALTVALGTPVTVDDTLIATNDLHVTSATAAMTLAGTPADADFLAFQISRNPGIDTLSADAKLLGVSIRLTTDAAKDA